MCGFTLEIDHSLYYYEFSRLTIDAAHCQYLKCLAFAFLVGMITKLCRSLIWMFLNIHSSPSNLPAMIYTVFMEE